MVGSEKPQYLKHGESFVRARRNYMLSAVTLIVLAAADPARIKIPGLGDDATLPSMVAYAALWLAMTYFGWEYYAEHTYVRLDNSEAAARADAEDRTLLDQMRLRIETLSSSAAQINDMKLIASVQLDPDWHRTLDEEAINTIKNGLAHGASMAERLIIHNANPGQFDPKLFENAISSFSPTVDQKVTELTSDWGSRRNRFARQVYAIESEALKQLPIIAQHLRETSEALGKLDVTYRRVSKRVHATLSSTFRWKDTWLAIALFATATFMPLVLAMGYHWNWRD